MKQEYGVDLAAARRSREAQARASNEFYDEQAHILAQWIGKEPPADLILGALPVVNLKQIRLDTD